MGNTAGMPGAPAFTLPPRLTMAEAAAVLNQLASLGAPQAGWAVQAGELAQFDSAALAVLLQAARQGAHTVLNPPPKLQALARMYGVAEVLGLEPQRPGAANDASGAR